MAGLSILLPHNFTSYDQKAVDFVTDTFARREEINVTLFHTYTPPPEIEISDSSITGKLRSSMSYLNKQISEHETALQAIKEQLISGGFSASQINTVFKPRKKDIAAEIVDLHADEKYDCIVLNHRPGRVGRFFTGSVNSKLVTALRDVTICTVT